MTRPRLGRALNSLSFKDAVIDETGSRPSIFHPDVVRGDPSVELRPRGGVAQT